MTDPVEKHSFELLKKDLKERNLTYDEYIGGGAFGKVFKAKHDIDGQSYAIKVIKINECYKRSTKSLHEIISKTKKETQLLASLSHPNVTFYQDCWFWGPGAQEYNDLKEDDSRPENEEVSSTFSRPDIPEFWLCIKMGFCQSNLRRWLEQNKTIELRLSNLEIVGKQILIALEYIHENRVIHRDVKPDNILIQKEQPLSIQIGDFGLSIKEEQESSRAGTALYMSPEMLQNRNYNKKTDVFSVGLVIFEFINVSLNNRDKRWSSFDEIRKGKYNFPCDSPIEINNLIKKMTMRGIGDGERPLAEDALTDFKKIFPLLLKPRVICCNSRENESGQDTRMEEGSVDDSPRPSTSHSSHHDKGRILNSRKRKNPTKFINPDGKKSIKNASHISHGIHLPAYNFQGRQKEIQLLHELFSKENPKYTDRRILINGLGGVGKTELCKKFLYEIKENASRIWLHGETPETVESSIKCFETQNPELFKSLLKSQQSPSQLFDVLCKKCLEKSSRLVVVMDNVDVEHEEATEIINLVRRHENLYVLVTSRNGDLFERFSGHTIKLEMLSDDEAKQLLEDSLKGLDVCESEQTKLCKLVGNFPLALQQAVAYIKMQKKKRSFKVSDYAEKLESILEQKLNNIDHNYKNTTEGTFQAAWDLMTEDAKEVLKVVAHLNPDEIVVDSLKVICSFFKLYDEGLDEALEMIINYSLATSNIVQHWWREPEEHLIVHRLVQKFITKQFNEDYSKRLCKLFLSLDNDIFSQLNEKLIENFLLDLKRIFCRAYSIKIEIENSIISKWGYDWKAPFDDDEGSFHICRYTKSDLTHEEYLLLLVKKMLGNSLIKHKLPNEGLDYLESVLYSGVDNLEEFAFNQILSIKDINYIEHFNESKNPSELKVGVKIRLAHEYENLRNFDRSSQLFNEVRELLPLLTSEINLMSEDSQSEDSQSQDSQSQDSQSQDSQSQDSQSQDSQSDMDDNDGYTAKGESVVRVIRRGIDGCGLLSDISAHMEPYKVHIGSNRDNNPIAMLNKLKDLHKRISLVTCDWNTVSRKEILCQFRDFKYEKLKSAELRRILKCYKEKLGEEDPLTVKVKYALAFRLYWNRSDALGKNTIWRGHRYISEYDEDTSPIYYEPEWYREYKKDADNPFNQTTGQMYKESIVLLKEVMDSGVDIEFWKVCDLIYHIGISYHRDKNYVAAVELLEKAFNYSEDMGDEGKIQKELKMVLADTYEKLSDWENALDSYSHCSDHLFNRDVRGHISRIKWKSGAMRNMTADDIRKEFSYCYYFEFYKGMEIKELKEALEFFEATVGDSEEITVALKTNLAYKVSNDDLMIACKLLMEILDSRFTDLLKEAAIVISTVCDRLKKRGKYIEESELLEKSLNCEVVLGEGYFDLCDIEKRFPDLYTKFGEKLKASALIWATRRMN